MFQGGKIDQQISDQIGRAWAAGLLDGSGVDPAVLRDVGREYAALYWMYWPPRVATVAKYGAGGSGKGPSGSLDSRDERFRRLDDLARGAGHLAYAAMQDFCVNGYWLPDDNCPWVARLLDEAMALPDVAWPSAGDRELLRAAVFGLAAMVS